MSVGTCNPCNLLAEVEVFGHRLAHLVQQPEVFRMRRDPLVKLVMGVSFRTRTAAAFTWAYWASISGGIASRRTLAEALTSLLTFSGYFTAVNGATPPPSE